ncbi:MAG: hypothetical protein WBO10_13185 [Pyrinomonadaceae bacterium]
MKKFLVIISFLLNCFTPVDSIGQAKGAVPKESRSIRSAPFRYVIIRGVSDIEQYVNVNPDNEFFEVLMEDGAFNESNLTALFKLLSGRFTAKSGLTVNVFTNLNAIHTPEENDRLGLKGPIEDYKKYKYAIFVRNGYGEYFNYGIPGRIEDKRIVIRRE